MQPFNYKKFIRIPQKKTQADVKGALLQAESIRIGMCKGKCHQYEYSGWVSKSFYLVPLGNSTILTGLG